MFIECIVIIVIILIMAYVAFRTGKKDFAYSMVPLITVPFFNILAAPIWAMFWRDSHVMLYKIEVVTNIVGLVVACIAFGLFAHKIESPRAGRLYLFICCAFSLILSLVLIFYGIGQILS